MNKTDKKSIVILLILAMLLVMLSPTLVQAAGGFNTNPSLESTTVKTKILGDYAFLSDGTLWKIDSETNATFKEKDIKDFNYAYCRYTSNYYSYYAKLKANGEMNFKVTTYDNEEDVKSEKTISNVKKIIEQYNGNYLAYQTYDNEIYFLDLFESKDSGVFVKTATDVESVVGAFYTKNGATYHVSGKKVADGIAKSSFGEYYAIGNSLNYARYRSMDYIETRNITPNEFVEFTYTDNINGDMSYKATDGSIKGLGTLSNHQYIGTWNKDEGSKNYLLSGNNVLYQSTSGSYPLTTGGLMMNVLDMKRCCNDDVIVFVRTDGSVWANKIRQATQFNKIISPSFNKLADLSKEKWYFNAAKYVFNNGMMTGLNATTFGPNTKLTRGMLVTILYKMEETPEVKGTSKFSDVKDSSKYYYDAVVWAANNKIVSGYKDGRFGHGDNITRQDLAVILNNYAKYKGKDVSQTNDLSAFKDKAKVSKYALPCVQWAVGAGVITGNAKTKTIDPKGNATRAEAAAMLQKYCMNLGK